MFGMRGRVATSAAYERRDLPAHHPPEAGIVGALADLRWPLARHAFRDAGHRNCDTSVRLCIRLVANDRFAFEETFMRVAAKGILLSALFLSLSGGAYAQGAGGAGAGGSAGGAGGGAAGAGQGGTGMSKPNASGPTDTMSGASGTSTMAPSGDTSQKKMQKKGGMDSPASSGVLKKAY
jgi:hypothetical protein